ncbi:hypothetical protein Tsp_13288, partial [Trichinella spiralis]
CRCGYAILKVLLVTGKMSADCRIR